MISRKLILLFLIVPIVLAIFFYSSFFHKGSNETLVTASRIIDGDTFELANGKTVRLLGIDAPEKGYYGYDEAKNKLKELIFDKKVILEKDVNNADKMDRLLRHVFVGDTSVNLEMVRQGFANVYIVLPDNKYEKELMQAEDEAEKNKVGLWKISDFANCFSISNFHYNAKGKDNENLNDEYVVLKNECDFSIDMRRWSIKDRTVNTFIFLQFELGPMREVRIFSGSGENSESDFYWNNEFPVWDNSGDTIYLRDSSGNLALTRSY